MKIHKPGSLYSHRESSLARTSHALDGQPCSACTGDVGLRHHQTIRTHWLMQYTYITQRSLHSSHAARGWGLTHQKIGSRIFPWYFLVKSLLGLALPHTMRSTAPPIFTNRTTSPKTSGQWYSMLVEIMSRWALANLAFRNHISLYHNKWSRNYELMNRTGSEAWVTRNIGFEKALELVLVDCMDVGLRFLGNP